ncbi:MAG: hypothetical protein IJI22_02145 [Bacilli bacterium]|nr:hypothetical protein [Bacilli bacterium]
MSENLDGTMLLKDNDEENSEHTNFVEAIKSEIINLELKDLSQENVAPEIKLIIENIPDDISLLEKVRWIYINLGKVFCYDYRIAYEKDYAFVKNTDLDKPIERYQTCIQISEILNKALNSIEGINARIVRRVLTNARGYYGNDHVAVEVQLEENGMPLKLLLDLTLDLYNIQSDCQTKHFGFEDDGSGEYDIISQPENLEMDKKLGFVEDERDYRDYRIEETLRELQKVDLEELSSKEAIEKKLRIINRLTQKFNGYHEGKRYMSMLFTRLLNTYFHEFNIYYAKDGQINLKSIFRINSGDYEKWVIYSNILGLMATNKEIIRNMLNDLWKTKSNSLEDIVSLAVENEDSFSQLVIKK